MKRSREGRKSIRPQAATATGRFAEATLNRYKALLAKNSLSRQESMEQRHATSRHSRANAPWKQKPAD